MLLSTWYSKVHLWKHSHFPFVKAKKKMWQKKKSQRIYQHLLEITLNNTVSVSPVSYGLSLSVSHNKSLLDRPVQHICGTGGSLLLLLNTKLYYWRLHPAQCFLIPSSVTVLILEMFSVANKSIMWSYTCNICKWIAVPHIASDGNQKNIVLWEKE